MVKRDHGPQGEYLHNHNLHMKSNCLRSTFYSNGIDIQSISGCV